MESNARKADLHAQADAKVRNIMRPCISGCQHHTLDPSDPKATRDQDAMRAVNLVPSGSMLLALLSLQTQMSVTLVEP